MGVLAGDRIKNVKTGNHDIIPSPRTNLVTWKMLITTLQKTHTIT